MLNYWNRQDNPATFETLTEVRANAPAVTAKLSGNDRFRQIPNPKLEDFPEGLVYIYRSPNLYGGQTAARNNTSFIVFADQRFETKEEGKAYLESLGLISLIDQAERELTESHSFKQLFNAMNITTDALNLINRAEKKRPIPDEDSFIKAAGKYKFSRDTDRERLEELFDQLEDYDSMVSDEAVNRLVMNSSEFSRIEREKVYDFTSDFGSIFQDEAFLESCERYDPNI